MKYDFSIKKFTETDTDADKLAVSGSDQDISWAGLKEKVEQLARLLTALKVPSGHPVVIYGHKEHVFPLAILACIHCNITYVPVDTIYPAERIKKILSATESQILINCTEEAVSFHVPVMISRDFSCVVNAEPDYENRIYGNADDPIQYILFTSGSTGEPKGVQITQAALKAFTDWVNSDYHFKSTDVFMNQAPFTFDISLYDMIGTFSNGATMILNSGDQIKNQDVFLNRIAQYGCTIWNSTPSFVYMYLRNPLFKGEHLPQIRMFIFSGEELPNRTASILKQHFKNAKVFNAYGPTEATVTTTLIEIDDDILQKYPSLPIGYPKPDSQLLIERNTEENKEGELIIVGDHVSVGYLKNQELNERKFYLHDGKRAFRTGDLAYYENEMLFFVGRNDDQIKLHGFRIELAEISSVIMEHEAVNEAVTIPLMRNNEVKKLISFIQLKSAQNEDSVKKSLAGFLKSKLPYYMIPGEICVVDSFPFTSSYKIDKKMLLENYLKAQLG